MKKDKIMSLIKENDKNKVFLASEMCDENFDLVRIVLIREGIENIRVKYIIRLSGDFEILEEDKINLNDKLNLCVSGDLSRFELETINSFTKLLLSKIRESGKLFKDGVNFHIFKEFIEIAEGLVGITSRIDLKMIIDSIDYKMQNISLVEGFEELVGISNNFSLKMLILQYGLESKSIYLNPLEYAKETRTTLDQAKFLCQHYLDLNEKAFNATKCKKCGNYSLALESTESETNSEEYLICEECGDTPKNYKEILGLFGASFDLILSLANNLRLDKNIDLGVSWHEFVEKEIKCIKELP